MPAKKILGVAILVNAVYVCLELITNIDQLKQSSDAFAAPEDSFWLYSALLLVNCFIVLASGALGLYVLKVKRLLLRCTVPLSVVMGLFGGFSIILGLLTIGSTVLQRYKPDAI